MALRRAITGRIVNPSIATGARSMSTWWRNVDSASKDSNIGVAGAVLADPSPNILNAGIGKETQRTTAGNLNIVDEKQVLSVRSRLQQLVRPMYSNPSIHGAPIGSSLGQSIYPANIRMTHSKAGFSTGNGEFAAKTTLRPLSPHLTVYKPQSSSTTSIFHRIAYIYMAVVALFYYLLYLKMGMICFTYEKFYQFFYYISELFPIINEISVVALAYYLYKGAEQFMKYR